MSTVSPLARIVLGAALAILGGLGLSLLLARVGGHRLMRWPTAFLITAAVLAAVVVGVRGWR